jgi:plasmid stabilization system protein ParE
MTLAIEPEAFDELVHAVSVIDAERPGWGLRFADEVDACIAHAAEHPESGEMLRGYPTEVRRFVVRRFPYVVVVAKIGDERKVIAIMHGHQAPGYWRERLPR